MLFTVVSAFWFAFVLYTLSELLFTGWPLEIWTCGFHLIFASNDSGFSLLQEFSLWGRSSKGAGVYSLLFWVSCHQISRSVLELNLRLILVLKIFNWCLYFIPSFWFGLVLQNSCIIAYEEFSGHFSSVAFWLLIAARWSYFLNLFPQVLKDRGVDDSNINDYYLAQSSER